MGNLGLKQVFMMMRPDLARFLVARGIPVADAEDLVHDLFLKIEGLASGPIGQPRAYLYQMANHLLLDYRRGERRRALRDEAWATANRRAADDADHQSSLEQMLIARERLRQVDAILNTLPERTADAFRRFRIAGETQTQIARDFGISLSAVEKHLQRAYRAVLDGQRRLYGEGRGSSPPAGKEAYVDHD